MVTSSLRLAASGFSWSAASVVDFAPTGRAADPAEDQSQAGAMTSRYADERVADHELWTLLRATGNEDAFRELFLRHSDAVYNFAFRRTASWSTAEEVTQATFARLWRRAVHRDIEELRLESARPILLAMARGECSNLNRARDRRLRLVDKIEAAAPSSADNIADWLEDEASMARINHLLDSLPAKHREVIELVVWSEISLADAAMILKVPVGTVKSRLSRARERLAGTAIASLAGEEQ